MKNETTSLPCVLRQQLLSPALAPDTDLGGGLFREAKTPFDELPLSDRQLILEVVTVERLKDTKHLWTLKVHLFCTLIGSERWARTGQLCCLVLPGSTPSSTWTWWERFGLTISLSLQATDQKAGKWVPTVLYLSLSRPVLEVPVYVCTAKHKGWVLSFGPETKWPQRTSCLPA